MVDKLEKKNITQVFAKKCVFKYKWKFLQPLKLYMRSQSAKHFATLGNDTISRSENCDHCHNDTISRSEIVIIVYYLQSTQIYWFVEYFDWFRIDKGFVS